MCVCVCTAKKRMDRWILNLALGLMNAEFMCNLCVVKSYLSDTLTGYPAILRVRSEAF